MKLDDELMVNLYKSYFPKTILGKYGDHIFDHRLKNQITATMIVNKAVNQAGTTIFPMIHSNTGADYKKTAEKIHFCR